MPLDDLRDFLDGPKLVLPIGGREYTVQPCKADVWLRLQEISNGEPIADMDLFRLCLGDTLQEMLPNVTGPELRRAGSTAYLWQLGQEGIAEEFWRSGGKAAVASPTRTRTRRATHTGGATTTRRQASGSGTSTRKKSSGNATG